ncbi:MAG: hypothetical protein M1829_004571 [Trizodia sp. TS-e1964]|nr:MAG: hypothetical protein M1829_004571 [Trizodia sp. TS-e1964]
MPAGFRRRNFPFPLRRLCDFWEAVRTIWSPPGSPVGPIGLAVSGGVDSMALAVLFRDLSNHSHHFTCIPRALRAFVVDHRAREGSDVEAKYVLESLQKLGIKSRVLTLEWPPGSNPLELANFETKARELRYQALGRACVEDNITELFLGHHEDDQAETVLMRLAAGHRGLGLEGMKSEAEIPDCYGIHGVHQSGALELYQRLRDSRLRKPRLHERKQNPSPPTHIPSAEPPSTTLLPAEEEELESSRSPMHIENGGVRIYRPLLGFSKRTLISICQRNNIFWVNDHTNLDPTLTQRNAVRSLLEGNRLPLALCKASLLRLSRRMRQERLLMTLRTTKIIDKSQIIVLDTRSGGLGIRFRNRFHPRFLHPEPHLSKAIQAAKHRAENTLSRAIDFVGPQHSPSRTKLALARQLVFPDLECHMKYEDEMKAGLRMTFTIAGVQFKRVELPLPPETLHYSRFMLDPQYVWMLTREPFRAGAMTMLSFNPAAPGSWSAWQLWDGRYWIRVRCARSEETVVVRPFAEADMKPFRAALSPEKRAKFACLLKICAPAKVRWTMPALATLAGRVLALPSLGIGVEDGGVMWDIRYKHVELGRHKDLGIVA